MEQSPSGEANIFSVSQQILRILWNRKVHYYIHNCPPPVPILSQLDSVHTHTSCNSILILSSHLCLGLPSGPFPSGFTTEILYTPLLFPHTCYMPHPSHSPPVDHQHIAAHNNDFVANLSDVPSSWCYALT